MTKMKILKRVILSVINYVILILFYSINKKLKVIYKVICLSLMIYQIISLTLIYISFPFRVNLYLTDDQNQYLPSITVCIPFNKECLIEYANNTYNIKTGRFSRIIPQESIKCEIFYKTKNNSFEKIDCNKIANIISKFEMNSALKCFTYFQIRELLFNSTIREYELIHIDFRFIKSILSNPDSCFNFSPKLIQR
jgi:hypothetical protein